MGIEPRIAHGFGNFAPPPSAVPPPPDPPRAPQHPRGAGTPLGAWSCAGRREKLQSFPPNPGRLRLPLPGRHFQQKNNNKKKIPKRIKKPKNPPRSSVSPAASGFISFIFLSSLSCSFSFLFFLFSNFLIGVIFFYSRSSQSGQNFSERRRKIWK